MMPVIMAFFFWVFQANIYMTALNQSAYAAFAGARTHLVLGGPGGGGMSADKTVKRILTGQLFEGDLGAPQVSDGDNLPGRPQGATRQGIKINLKSLSTLPYVRSGNLLGDLETEVSTHLGWQEYDEQRYTNTLEREKIQGKRTGRKFQTDNNLTDYGS